MVKLWTASKANRGLANCAVACLMLTLWLGTLLLAVSPELHRLLHADAQKSTHQCLVTQVKEHSLLLGSVCAFVSAPPLVPIFGITCSEFDFLATADQRLLPPRGPPALFSLATVAG